MTAEPAKQPLTRETVHCPITALAFFTSRVDGRLYLLAGEDTSLVLYDAQQQTGREQPLARCAVFPAQAVHGIRVDDDGGVLVWGASSVALLSRDGVERMVRKDQPGAEDLWRGDAPDLVYDGAVSPSDASRGVLVTAHNEVVPFAAGTGGGALVMGKLVSPSRPILYSAHVTWTSTSRALVAGGTVFGEVVVWSCDVSSGAEAGAAEVLHVFSGHEGSIFGVHISPEVEIGGTKRRLLATCSDDRTVRVWDVSSSSGAAREEIGARAAEIRRRVGGEARETGFTSEPEVAAAMELAEKPLAVAMGHDSRIWGVKFACRGSRRDGEVVVYTFGEDSTTQEWRLEVPRVGGTGEGKLSHVRTHGFHAGKHIWARAVLDREDRDALVATGGADWKIVLIADVDSEEGAPDGQTVTLTVPDIDVVITAAGEEGQDREQKELAARAAWAGKPVDKELLHSFEFIAADRILASTSLGRLFLGTFGPAGDVSWSTVRLGDSIDYDMVGYNTISSPKDGTAWIGSASGRVYLYDRQGQVSEAFQLGRKIPSVLSLPHGALDDLPPTHVEVLVTSMAPEGGTLVTVNTSEPGPGKAVARSTVGREEGLLITSATVCRGLLVVGTRKGTIHLYGKVDDGNYVSVAWTKLQVKDAVTSLIPLPGRNGNPPSSVLATCRDGAYRIFTIDDAYKSGITPTLRLVHESSPPAMGPVQAGATFTKDHELVILGFQGTGFVAWNETRQEEVAAVQCGGANRKVAYVTTPSDAGFLRFAYTKTSTLNIFSQRRAVHRTVRSGGHGREVRSVCARGELVATGGEDTILRIWRRGAGGDLRCAALLNPHRTGIPALKWVGDEYLLSAGGFEDLYVWRVSRLDSDYQGLAVARESKFPDQSKDKDLRIMSIDADPVDGGMVVSMAFSNSTIKTYYYTHTSGWRLLAQGKYTGACPTEVRHLDVDIQVDRGLVVMATFTDGHVTAWKAARRPGEGDAQYEEYSLQAAVRMHQNAVKALDLDPLPAGAGWLVLTGSDDNALGVTHLLPAAGATSFAFGSRHRVSKAHAASINGLQLVRHNAEARAVVFVTCSNDQRVKTWRVETVPEGEGLQMGKMQLLGDQYSSVADPGAMEVLGPEGPLVVVGVGMETWGLKRVL